MTDAQLELTTLWERTSKGGTRYFSGVLGGVTVLVFKDERAEVPAGVDAIWRVILKERAPKPAAGATARPSQPAASHASGSISRPADPPRAARERRETVAPRTVIDDSIDDFYRTP